VSNNGERASLFTMVASPQPGPRRNGESAWQFLERSSEPVAVAARARWDDWLSRMPEGPRDTLISRLRARHGSMSLDTAEPPGRTSQPQSRTKTRQSRRRDTDDHHAGKRVCRFLSYFLMIRIWTFPFFSMSARNCAVSRMKPRS